MLRVLRQPRWVALTLLVVVLVTAFVELGLWQLRRHEQRAALNAVLEANLDRSPVPVAELVDSEPVVRADEWRQVTLTGTFDLEHELLVRNQTYDGDLGYGVLTPLVPTDGPAVLVDRGWVPAGLDAQAVPEVDAPPVQEVTVVGRVRPTAGDDAGTAGLPPGQVRAVAVAAVAGTLPYPVLEGGYVALVAGQPGTGVGTGDTAPQAVRAPEPSAGAHLAYAVQWFLFGVIAVVGWFVLARSAARDEQVGARAPVRAVHPSAPATADHR